MNSEEIDLAGLLAQTIHSKGQPFVRSTQALQAHL
jgi:hypothetical protein